MLEKIQENCSGFQYKNNDLVYKIVCEGKRYIRKITYRNLPAW
jgi:hypothetical protein